MAMVQGSETAAALAGAEPVVRRKPKPTTCRMFETPIIEKNSRISPLTPFLVYPPLFAYLGYRAHLAGAKLLPSVGLFFAGLLLWSLVEYVLHRWVFHYSGPRSWQARMHFVLHGVHHDFPQDHDRLVMPLGASIPIAILTYIPTRLLLGPVLGEPLFVGFGLGYLIYDGTHYAIHHFKMSWGWGKWIKRHHMVHHHTGEQARWGVSSPLWDVVFGTMGSKPRREAARSAQAS